MNAGRQKYLAALGDASYVTFDDDEVETIVGVAKAASKKTSTAAKKAAAQGGSVMIDKTGAFVNVDEKVLLFGVEVPKQYVPTILYTRGAQIALLAAIGCGVWYLTRKSGRRYATNPRTKKSKLERHPNRDVAKAAKFRREFHWGHPARRVTRKKLSPTPKVLTELGEVAEITYRTRKRGESAQLFRHEFEGRRPRLGMDISNKRLHILGGSYTVTADGITG